MIRTRTDIIQTLIDRYKLNSYVEIGLQNASNNFDKIKCNLKISVDPDLNAKADFVETSDYFFNTLKPHVKFDIFFIDGLHEADQVEKDIINALLHLNEDGFIVCHDMNPPTELHTKVPRESKQWNGDCYRAWIRLRERRDLYMFVVDCDWGCGIITPGYQSPLRRIEELTYENFAKNREDWLNLIPSEFFVKMLRKC